MRLATVSTQGLFFVLNYWIFTKSSRFEFGFENSFLTLKQKTFFILIHKTTVVNTRKKAKKIHFWSEFKKEKKNFF